MRRTVETVGWFVASFVAGLVVIIVSRATAPAVTDGDVFDSDFFLPLTALLGVLAFAAGYRLPGGLAFVSGLLSVVPYFACVFGIGFAQTSEQRAFMWVGFFFLLPYAAVPVSAAVIGSAISASRGQGRPARH